MRFITEDDLRELYGKQPFASYEMIPGTRLTPGARQFLADRRIFPTEVPKAKINRVVETGDLPFERLGYRIKSMKAMFLAGAEDLLSFHARRAIELIELGEHLGHIESLLKGETTVKGLESRPCTGMADADFPEDNGDCFEIRGHHIQLAAGKEIIIMHRLRCSLRELKADIKEDFSKAQTDTIYDEAEKIINQIINTLSQLICDAVGGMTCQKET